MNETQWYHPTRLVWGLFGLACSLIVIVAGLGTWIVLEVKANADEANKVNAAQNVDIAHLQESYKSIDLRLANIEKQQAELSRQIYAFSGEILRRLPEPK